MKQVLVIVSLLMAATSVAADPVSYTEAQVKRHYLNCDYVSSHRMLDAGESSHCAAVASRLLMHHFRGNLQDLLSWWRSERDAFRQAARSLRDD